MAERIDVLIIVIIILEYGWREGGERKKIIFSPILLQPEKFSRSFASPFFLIETCFVCSRPERTPCETIKPIIILH